MPSSIDQLVADPIATYPSATVACFDPTTGDLPRRRLDAPRTKDFLQKLSAAGAPAVLIGASTGHGHARTVDELAEWFAVAADAPLGNTVRMALLRPEDGLEANRRLLRQLAKLKYPVVFFRPGTDLPRAADDRTIVATMQPLVQAAAELPLAIGLYSIPDVSGVALTPDAAASLVAGPGGDRVVAVKVTEADYATSTRRFLEHPALARLKIVQGWDTHLAAALRDGPRFDRQQRQRCGVTSGPMSFAVYQYQHIFAAAARGDEREVEQAQQAVTLLFQSMQDDPGKFADLQRAKMIMGLGQPLLGTVTDAQVQRLFAALEAVPRPADRQRLAQSLDLMGDGPFHARLTAIASAP